jgi:hypothetical protein
MFAAAVDVLKVRKEKEVREDTLYRQKCRNGEL